MKESIRTVYQCDHCNKKYFSKRFALKHEDECTKNPENVRPCLSCHLCVTKEFIVDYQDTYTGGEQEIIQRAMFCSHFKKGVYSPIVSKKWDYPYEFLHSIENDDEFENEPMPESCKIFDENKYRDQVEIDIWYP